jgi:hypothetical protein
VDFSGEGGSMKVISKRLIDGMIEEISGAPFNRRSSFFDLLAKNGEQMFRNGERCYRYSAYVKSQTAAKQYSAMLEQMILDRLGIEVRADNHIVASGDHAEAYASAGSPKVEMFVPVQYVKGV